MCLPTCVIEGSFAGWEPVSQQRIETPVLKRIIALQVQVLSWFKEQQVTIHSLLKILFIHGVPKEREMMDQIQKIESNNVLSIRSINCWKET